MRGALVAAALACAAAGCTPEIGAGTYFCGPELYCPPDLECNPNTFTCDTPGSFPAFACPENSEIDEPDDDTISNAPELGRLDCNYTSEFGPFCVDDLGDVDLRKFEIGGCATGSDPHVEVEVRFPVAMAPLAVEILDENENVVATGELCTPSTNISGMEWFCAEMGPIEGTYYIRVRAVGSVDCDGECPFNIYQLYVRYPLA